MSLNLKEFIKNTKATLSIEASIIFPFLMILIVLVSDTSIALNTKSRLDNISYNLASLIRQRDLFSQDLLKEDEAKSINKIAKFMLKDFIKEDDYGLLVEVLYFDSSSTKENQLVKGVKSFRFGNKTCEVSKLQESKNLSVFTSKSRWSSLYRVSLCAKLESKFLASENLSSKFISLNSSSITSSR